MRKEEFLLITRILTLNFIIPVGIYWYLTNYTTTSILLAIVYSGIPPFCDALLHVAMERKVDAINCVVLLGTIIGVGFALLTNSAKLLLLKDSIVTSLFGFGFLLSLTPQFGRIANPETGNENLVWWYNRTFQGVTPEQKTKLDAEWANPLIRNATVVLCYVWGFGYLSEAIVRIILLYIIDINTMVYLSIMAPFVWTLIMGVWSFFYERGVRKTFLKEITESSKAEEVVTLNGEVNIQIK